ncbi:pathogenesis-related protein PR-1 type-like [Phragmites australis]|uniref:pathogenesis-related protein PR-1 type-like n=1 Tax=Phragmites australis TaxID=29695 RepID=UPI002D77D636|nr:pathogenesis-related protein PR-1 type-like [Phragmites australis]
MLMRSDRRVLDKMCRHAMVRIHAAVLCLLLLFSGRPAAASKTFGSDSTAPKDESLTPTPESPSESAPAIGQSETPAASGEGSSSTDLANGTPSSAESPDEPTDGLNEKAINDIVKEHNVFRAKEHVPPLQWNATLAKFSQQYAEQLKGECKMVHSTSPYGENLMLGTGAVTWKTTVDMWSAEKESYHYGSNTCDPGKMCGHYTAVVWKGTTAVGCGRVKCNNGDTMIVCSYWPPGNYDGVRPF